MRGSSIRTRSIDRVLKRAERMPGLVVSDGEETRLLCGDSTTMWTITNELNVDTEPLVLTLSRPAVMHRSDRIECTLSSRGEVVDLRTGEDLERLVALWRLRGVEGAELVDTLTLPGWKQLALFPLDEASDDNGGEAA
jgi:hypothetical protein